MSRSSKRVVTMTLPSGMTIKVPYVSDALAFEHEGMSIRNPFLSDCGRFSVDPEYYGFKPHHTGGGCMALRKDRPDGKYYLLTDSGGSEIPTAEEADDALLGLYEADEQFLLVKVGDIPFDSDE